MSPVRLRNSLDWVTVSVGLTASPNPAVAGAVVTLTATVVALGFAVPTGTVIFKDSGIAIGVGTINGAGVATFATSSLGTGTHSLTATFAGNDTYNSAGSSAYSQVITAGSSLTPSGPVVATFSGQIFENLDIVSTSGAQAVLINGFSNVQVRNCRIRHLTGYGVNFSNATGLSLYQLDIEHTGAPATGANPNDGRNNINGYGSSGVRIDRIRMRRGSSGVYLIQCPGAWSSFLDGQDFRGPFPRGQLIQYDRCHNGIIEDFSSLSIPGQSWDEDNVNLYLCSNVTVRRGLLDGNNSPSGIGVIFEQFAEGATGGLVEDVDVIRQGNGCFSAYTVGFNITFRRTRARENICTDQGRGAAPSSGGLMWASGPGSSGNRILDSTYWLPCNPSNIVWDTSTLAEPEQLTNANYTQRSPIVLTMPWE